MSLVQSYITSIIAGESPGRSSKNWSYRYAFIIFEPVFITDIYVLFVATCGGSFTSATGSLSSPNYPHNYDNNLNCYWTITVPSGLVELTFSSFRTYSYNDYLLVSGNSNSY